MSCGFRHDGTGEALSAQTDYQSWIYFYDWSDPFPRERREAKAHRYRSWLDSMAAPPNHGTVKCTARLLCREVARAKVITWSGERSSESSDYFFLCARAPQQRENIRFIGIGTDLMCSRSIIVYQSRTIKQIDKTQAAQMRKEKKRKRKGREKRRKG
jgi:hypothetical protein